MVSQREGPKYWNYFLYFITKEQVKATVVPRQNKPKYELSIGMLHF
jgi:hypothetical protein